MARSVRATARPNLLIRILQAALHYARLAVGSVFIAIGILGVILPGLPSMPFFMIATLLIGRRSRLLRRGSVAGKRALRRWATDERPLVRRLGGRSLALQRDTSRRLRWMNGWLAARSRALRRRLARA